MPNLNGIDAARELARAVPTAAVLVLTMFDDDDSAFAVMRAGRGYRVQVVLVEGTLLVACQAKMGQGGGDPVVLGLGEGDGVGWAAGHDGPLEDRVAAAQDRVDAQGVAEPEHG